MTPPTPKPAALAAPRAAPPPSPLGPGLLSLVAGAVLLLGHPAPARAAGLLVADGGLGGALEIEEQTVRVTINNGIAVTDVTQVFRNLEKRQVEALYTFPVPRGASVSNFSMWINGKEMVGEVVEKRRAREIYESYKARRVDPGLLEQVDFKTFEMRIFPIAPEGEQRVQITYYQELEVDQDWATYLYPLATATRDDIDSRTRGRFSFTAEVDSEVPIVSMESPSHGDDVAVAKHSERHYEASLETREGDLNRDVLIAYHLSRPRTGMDVIASKEPGEDGFFLATVTVGEDLAALDRGMDYVFVLDVSGSMEHEGKLAASRGSIGSFIEELGGDDRFELITFNIQPLQLFRTLQVPDDASRDAARDFLAGQTPRGGTVLRPAIELAYKYGDPDRPLVVVVLSDGMTETGDRSGLLQLIRGRPSNARVFCIGVGNEVNRPLLEKLAEDAGGLAAFVSRGDDFARQARAFRRKLLRPAATDVRLSFSGVEVYDLEPARSPNLYHGLPLRIYGRYKGSGEAKVSLKADVAGRTLERTERLDFPKADADNPELERMWAWKRIDRLLKESEGSQPSSATIDEVVALGETYSIVCEHTSFLVLENDAEYARWKIERRNLARTGRDRKARERLASRLESMREQALAGLGPATDPTAGAPAAAPLASAAPVVPSSAPASAPASKPARDWSPPRRPWGGGGGGGSGPVGPLFLGLAALLARRKHSREPAARE